jgi:hypothetical protein
MGDLEARHYTSATDDGMTGSSRKVPLISSLIDACGFILRYLVYGAPCGKWWRYDFNGNNARR